VYVISKVPQKPNNIKNLLSPLESKIFLTEKVYLQREDGSRLCLIITLVNLSGMMQDNTA